MPSPSSTLQVDTEATLSSFDAAGLGKWGAVRLGGADAQAWRGKVKAQEVHLRGLTLGKYDTRRAWAVVHGAAVDLAGMNDVLAAQEMKPIQGLLGNQDLLNGSAVFDVGTDPLCLRPIKETLWPELAAKWAGVTWESEGKKGQYKRGYTGVELKDGWLWLTRPGAAKEWGFHLRDEGFGYRLALFDPAADELADGFRYSSGGRLKLAGGTLTLVIPQGPVRAEPTTSAAPAGSGLLLVECERVKCPPASETWAANDSTFSVGLARLAVLPGSSGRRNRRLGSWCRP